MILRNREITREVELFSIIDEAQVCHLAMTEGDQPYVLPMNFARDGNCIYFHCDNIGYKLSVIEANPKVCVNFNTGNELFHRHEEVACSWGMKYKSVNISGIMEMVEEYDEKYRIMKQFMLKYAGKEYEFSVPSIKNVRIYKVVASEITGKKYGY